jgi:hypothetical protein
MTSLNADDLFAYSILTFVSFAALTYISNISLQSSLGIMSPNFVFLEFFSDGKLYKGSKINLISGEFVKDKKHGRGILTMANG